MRNNIGNARKTIHGGKVPEFGYLLLATNCSEVILNDGKIDDTRSDYFVPLQNDFLPDHRGASFHVEPYSPISSAEV